MILKKIGEYSAKIANTGKKVYNYSSDKWTSAKNYLKKEYKEISGIKKLEDAIASYQNNYEILREKYEEIENKRKTTKIVLDSLNDEKKKAIIEISKLRQFTENIQLKKRNISEAFEKTNIDLTTNLKVFNKEIEKFNVNDLAKGAVTGASTGLGAWSLVATYGAASTGTLNATLSGAALTNSVLAFFGGGSIASGGLGIAAGSLTIGGITLLPAILSVPLYQRIRNNKKTKEVINEIQKIIRERNKCENVLLFLNTLELKSIESKSAIVNEIGRFQNEFIRIHSEIFKYGFFSKIFRNLKIFFGFNYYNQVELENINSLLLFSESILKLVDEKIISGDDEELWKLLKEEETFE